MPTPNGYSITQSTFNWFAIINRTIRGKIWNCPLVFTSIVRRNFNENNTLVDTHGAYPFAMRMVAEEFQVPLIDLQYLTEKLEESYGVENSKKLHLHYVPVNRQQKV